MINSSFWKNKRIFVTGHTGFKGSWLILWLLEMGAEVWGYALRPNLKEKNLFINLSKNFSNKFHDIDGNILNLEFLNSKVLEVNPDVVFHLAAQPLVRFSYENPIITWQTNVIGSLNLLESLKKLEKKCSVVMITTDKVYKNNEWTFGYRENDTLGGHDPYSASKAAMEIAVESWRLSYCGKLYNQNEYLLIATARAGNVIGGGDWSKDRLIPDCIRSLIKNKAIQIRNPKALRPWQHVLDPLRGYLLLAQNLYENSSDFQSSFNFGPRIESNKSVDEVVDKILSKWQGSKEILYESEKLHESNLLYLSIDKSFKKLNWEPIWDFPTSIDKTINWYQKEFKGDDVYQCCLNDLQSYLEGN